MAGSRRFSAGRSDLLQIEPEAVRAAKPVEREHRVALEGGRAAFGILRHELIEIEVPRVAYLIGIGTRVHGIADRVHGPLEEDAVAMLGRRVGDEAGRIADLGAPAAFTARLAVSTPFAMSISLVGIIRRIRKIIIIIILIIIYIYVAFRRRQVAILRFCCISAAR